MNKKNKKYYILGVIALALLVASFLISIYYSSKPGAYDEFASCIEKSGAKFYGAFWCPHCQEQKSLFGKSKDKLPYVECSTASGKDQTQECKDKKIESYPTWEFLINGTTTRVGGVQSFTKLSGFTNCAIPQGYVDKLEAKEKKMIEKIKVQGSGNIKIEEIQIATSTK